MLEETRVELETGMRTEARTDIARRLTHTLDVTLSRETHGTGAAGALQSPAALPGVLSRHIPQEGSCWRSKGGQAHAKTAGGCPSGPGPLRDVRCRPQGDSGIEAAASAPHQVACAPPRAADHPAVGFQCAREGVAWGFP